MLWDREILEKKYPDECKEIREDERQKVIKKVIEAVFSVLKDCEKDE